MSVTVTITEHYSVLLLLLLLLNDDDDDTECLDVRHLATDCSLNQTDIHIVLSYRQRILELSVLYSRYFLRLYSGTLYVYNKYYSTQ